MKKQNLANPSSHMVNPKISYPALEKNLPQNNELRDYLINKEETRVKRRNISILVRK